MAESATAGRCVLCRRGLDFSQWSAGGGLCARCLDGDGDAGPAAAYTPGPVARTAPTREFAAYERMLDDIPDELIDELVAALEAEAARAPTSGDAASVVVRELLDEIGVGRDPRAITWAAWGFSAGFGVNVFLAKYVQISTGATMQEFVGPMLIGGMVAGVGCAALAWGIARLKGP